jgi:hypothetical protein
MYYFDDALTFICYDMIKNDQLTFKELPPPMITKVLTINHPEQELIYEHWRHLMAAIEI